MAAQFESFTYPSIIMTSLLFAFSGCSSSLWITGHALNIIIDDRSNHADRYRGEENGIVLIDYHHALNRERGMSIRRAVIDEVARVCAPW